MLRHDPRRVAYGVFILILLSLFGMVREASASQQAKATAQKASQQKPAPGKQIDEFHRPEPTRPFTPQIPTLPKYDPKKVYLEFADSILKVPDGLSEHQVVVGNVKFRQMGTWLFCDSAWYYPEKNSLDAFGHVKMEQGDTLFAYADKLYYDGTSRFARLRCGPSQSQVKIENHMRRQKRTASLTTDSLDYDLASELAWYNDGGTLRDGIITLTSVYGQYSPRTKDAEFFHNVVLNGNRNNFHMETDTLYYNTATNLARIVTPTTITTDEDEIITSNGTYNTRTRQAELLGRSTIFHTDSLNRTTTLEGDSIVHDPARHMTIAYQFNDRYKRSSPVVITDTARKAILIGGYGYYNDLTREALAARYPLMKEYSRGDTLYLRADTILTQMKPRPVKTDSLGIPIPRITKDSKEDTDSMWHYASAFPRARFFRTDVQGVADTIVFTEIDSLLYLRRLPVVWNEERQVRGDTIILHLNDSTADWARIPSKAKLMEHIEDDFYDQLHSDKMMMWFENGTLRRLEAEGSVETIMLPEEKDSTYNRFVQAESSYLTIDMDDKKLKKLKMWPETSGSVTPLFLVKNSMKLLRGARWLDAIRPKSEEVDGRIQWADDLGEIPEELEKYFNE